LCIKNKVLSLHKKDMIEFNTVLYLKKEEDSVVEYAYEKEALAKYRFNPDEILEVTDTFILYDEEWHNGITVFYRKGDHINETPPILGTYEDLVRKMKENESNKKKTDFK